MSLARNSLCGKMFVAIVAIDIFLRYNRGCFFAIRINSYLYIEFNDVKIEL